ncbi:hypothetical protein [Microbaculum sp. FT89]|uniref:hypothetical protein n=1 Tax=Microbaculum sp. FT89 TaxID=3447298 RepID=UPI003F5346BD
MDCPVCEGTGVVVLDQEDAARSDSDGREPSVACRSCGGSGIRSATGEAPDAGRSEDPSPGRNMGPATPEDELYTTRQLLVFTLRYSRVFPPEATEGWIDGLIALDAIAPEAGRAILAELREGYDWAKARHRPDGADAPGAAAPGTAAADGVLASAGLAGGGVAAAALADGGVGLAFRRETGEIERHLDRLDTLLIETIAHLDAEAD